MRHNQRFLLLTLAATFSVVFAATTEAQSRHGHGRAVVVVGGGYYPRYYNPYFFADPWFGYQYPYPLVPYGHPMVERGASMRLDVKPKNAEVYVDGYYAGVVDDFDGTFQGLHVEPGQHEVALWLEGYRTVRQQVFLTPNNTFRIKYSMERLAEGEAQNPKPLARPGGEEPPPMRQPMPQGPPRRRMPPPPAQQPPDRGDQGNQSYGSLVIRVQSGDAQVSIDGEV